MHMQQTEEISFYILNYTSCIFDKILQNNQYSIDDYDSNHKYPKKQENYIAFPFSISLESSKISKISFKKPMNFHKNRPPFIKNNTFSPGRKPASIKMSELFFSASYDDNQNSPNNLTERLLHQMENDDTNNAFYIEKEENSTMDTAEIQKNPINQINEEKFLESMDTDDKEMLDLLSNNHKNYENNEVFDFLQGKNDKNSPYSSKNSPNITYFKRNENFETLAKNEKNSPISKKTLDFKKNQRNSEENENFNDFSKNDKKMSLKIEDLAKSPLKPENSNDYLTVRSEIISPKSKKTSKNEEFLSKSSTKDLKNINEHEIEDENIPLEVKKSFKQVSGNSLIQQKVFHDLDNSNITYIEETSSSRIVDGKQNKLNVIFDRNVVREGVFLRKTRNLLSGWESVWILLTQEKLQYFTDQTKNKLKGGINFRLAKCSVTLKDCLITIKIKGYNKFLKLKTCSKTLAREWAKLIDDVIFNNQTESKLDIRFENMDKYLNDDFMSEEEFTLICETGDILLFETKNFPAKFQRALTGSKYDHVALVMKFGEEAWIFDAQADKGVSLLKWCEFIDINDLFTKVVYRKLHFSNKDQIDDKLFTFIANNIGKKYELTLTKILFRKKSEMHVKIKNPNPKKNTKKEANSGFFCSELVAAAYKELGLLDPHVSAAQYWPGNFSLEKNLKLLQGAILSEEITVVLDRDLI